MDCLLEPSPDDIPVLALTPEGFAAWSAHASENARAWCAAAGFEAQEGRQLALPNPEGGIERVLFGLGSSANLWTWAHLTALPAGRFALEPTEALDGEAAALAFALGAYRFDRYKVSPPPAAKLAWPAGLDRAAVTRLVEGICLARDLVNTPAGDLGPAELAGAARELAERHGATFTEIVGEDLLREGFPAVHAVGRAASRAPRLIDLVWGDEAAPKVTLVGKGVVFDSGGLDLKPADGMKLMKKDMGGAATVLGLAHAVMDAGLKLRLRVLVPAVENAVAGNAFRPGDVLQTRKGLTVEVGNTDAEGRLVLADALAAADEQNPELVLDFATLTGAARVALGTELPGLFTGDDSLADDLMAAGRVGDDQLWRLPLHDDYRRHLDSPVADLNNISSNRFGGAITAALFLREFVSKDRVWAHVDTMGWNESSRPGRPQGGEAFGLRATFHTLAARYGG
jgi:leucyl aminopeptidase